MPNLLKAGSNIFIAGNTILRYGRSLTLGQVYSQLTTGISNPYGIAVDSANNRLLIGNRGTNTIAIYNLTTLAYISNFSVAANVLGLLILGNNLYIGSQSTVEIMPLTGAGALTITNTITQAQGNFSNCLSFDADPTPVSGYPSGRLFCTNANTNTVSIVSLSSPNATATVITTLQGSFNAPVSAVVDINGNQLIVSNDGNNTLSVLNLSNPTAGSATVISAASAGLTAAFGLIPDFANNRLFVCNQTSSGTVPILALSNLTAGYYSTITNAQGSFNAPTYGAIYPAGNKIFISNNTPNTISVLSNIFT